MRATGFCRFSSQLAISVSQLAISASQIMSAASQLASAVILLANSVAQLPSRTVCVANPAAELASAVTCVSVRVSGDECRGSLELTAVARGTIPPSTAGPRQRSAASPGRLEDSPQWLDESSNEWGTVPPTRAGPPGRLSVPPGTSGVTPDRLEHSSDERGTVPPAMAGPSGRRSGSLCDAAPSTKAARLHDPSACCDSTRPLEHHHGHVVRTLLAPEVQTPVGEESVEDAVRGGVGGAGENAARAVIAVLLVVGV